VGVELCLLAGSTIADRALGWHVGGGGAQVEPPNSVIGLAEWVNINANTS